MHIFGILFGGDIYWRIHREDPLWQDLYSLPDWFFINPLVYPQLDFDRHKIPAIAHLLLGDSAVVSTKGMVIGTTRDQFGAEMVPFALEMPQFIRLGGEESESQLGDIVPPYAESLALSLRQVSKQIRIPTHLLIMSSKKELTDLPPLKFPRAEPNSEVYLQSYIWDTAITWKQLIEADRNLLVAATPVYDELLLDAIHAFEEKDFRRACLFSAIAIETVAATKLDEVYRSALQNGDSETVLRITTFAQAKGVSITKDPVYDFLMAKSKFAERLHQVPLYLMGRSLLVENQLLYQRAIELYRIRNKIAHMGGPSRVPSNFDINEQRAREAIECALEVFAWFGETTPFPMPRLGTVQGVSVEESWRAL